ncbi:MAG TPA: IS481 family transposase [Proteobacteria bacterium]|nr:IS481 family transposase [Pseudomonadota bacterium]
MTEEQKKEVAVFRYGLIAEFVGATRLDRGEREVLLKEKCARKWQIPYSGRTRVSRSTLMRWISRYLEEGRRLEALYPQERNDQGQARAIDEETALALLALRKEMRKMPVPELTRVLHQRQLVSSGRSVSLSSVYRFLRQHKLMTADEAPPTDRRKFEAELPNDLWQSDILHGPVLDCDGKRRKCYLIAFIDDHSRLIPHARFYPSESLACFQDAFFEALSRRGLPRKLYVDNGSAYRSRQLEYTTAALGIALIHAKPYQPQGKGKIERFLRTVRTQFLSCFQGQSLEAINRAFGDWLEGQYHQRRHGSTCETPHKRFAAGLHCLRPAPSNLSDYFRKTVYRRVNKDRSIVIDKRLFEGPVDLIGQRVELLYHERSPEQVEIRHQGQSYGLLVPIDLQVNARVKRDKNGQIELSGATTPHSGQLWES